MSRAIVIISALLCVLICYSAAAQNKRSSPEQPSVLSAQRLMVRQRYPEATAQIRAILQKHPNDINALYTLTVIEQTRILDYESYAFEGKRFQVLADSVKKVIETRLPHLRGADSVQALFYRANLVGSIGIMQAKNGEWISGARSAMFSADMLRQVKKLDPGHLGADLGIGVFDYYLGTAFKWVPFVTGASAERGLAAIERAKEAPFPFNHAAKNTYCWILIDRKQFAKADSIAHAVLTELPGNSVFLRIRALIALWTGDYRSANKLGNRLIDISRERAPVNWSDLLSAYNIVANAQYNLGRIDDACATANTALSLQIPAEYRNISHIKDNLKNINGVKGKCKRK